MVTTLSGRRNIDQQELSVLVSHISFLISSQGQTQYIMEAAPTHGLQDPYLSNLDLSTSENIKLYNKAIVIIPESDGYDLTRSKWTDFYQEL